MWEDIGLNLSPFLSLSLSLSLTDGDQGLTSSTRHEWLVGRRHETSPLMHALGL